MKFFQSDSLVEYFNCINIFESECFKNILGSNIAIDNVYSNGFLVIFNGIFPNLIEDFFSDSLSGEIGIHRESMDYGYLIRICINNPIDAFIFWVKSVIQNNTRNDVFVLQKRRKR